MAEVQLSEKLLAGLAGWDVVKQARSIVAEDRVLSSSWAPPLLRGVVQSGTTTYRAGLAIRRDNDAENLCTCRQSREWGTLCAHSIAVGLHFLKPAPASSPAPGASVAKPGSPAPSSGNARPAAAPPPRGTRDVRRLLRSDEGEPGETLTVQVVLPPTLAEGLARGRVTVFFEGRTARGLVPLASVPFDTAYRVEPADRRLLEAAEHFAGGDTPAMLALAPADFATLLEALVEHPRVTLGKARAVQILKEPWKPALTASLGADGSITLRLRPSPAPPAFACGPVRAWALAGTEFRPVDLPAECAGLIAGPIRLNRAQVPGFMLGSWKALAAAADLDADFEPGDFEFQPQAPRILLHLAGGLASLTAHLQCTYGARVITPGPAPEATPEWMPDPANPRRYTARDPGAERQALGRLLRAGFSGPDAQGRYQLHGQNPVLTFFAREYPAMEREWTVTLEERLERSTRQNLERIEPRFVVTPSGEQWFDLSVSWGSSAGTRVPPDEIQRLLRGGQNHTRLQNGRIALIDTGAVEDLETILVECAPDQHAGGYRMDQAQAGFLAASFAQRGWNPVAPAAWRERAREQTGEVRLECPPLGDLEEVVRPYQKAGVAWMAFLRRNGFGGILADEMGLGKTLQSLAFLRSLSAEAGDGRPHLVVCPTSVVPNWVREAARFVPRLKVLALQGADRATRFDQIPNHHLVVTSYALVRRDLERYREVEFDTVILDEAQHIKNRTTQNAQAVKAIRSRHRLVLTGTPLENSVLDLWSIFDFLMPGYLGSAQDFRDRYEAPIVRERCPATQSRLARRIRPFLLRRLKRDVAPELPPRIDQVVWCDLTPDQAAVYQQLLDATRREVTTAVGSQGLARSRMLVLTALLRLRQACCDLRLLGVDTPDETPNPTPAPSPAPPAARAPSPAGTDTPGSAGGKVEAFSELLEEALDGGHRVLVFSQFTRMLGLLRERLDAEQVRYCYLDGSTRDRGAEVARFQSSADIPVFLISLKAGGVGLNLAAADTVVHFDPWWNPAVEDQATDRAHRIGQTRVVTSYKLIARGTVEEKILTLQKRKRETLRNLLAGEEQLTEGLSWDEIQELLA